MLSLVVFIDVERYGVSSLTFMWRVIVTVVVSYVGGVTLCLVCRCGGCCCLLFVIYVESCVVSTL